MTVFITMLWWIVGGPAIAAVPVVLPRGEPTEDWVEPLAMAGLEPGPPGDGPWIIVAETEGHWWLVASTMGGAVMRTEVRPPTSIAEREELAFLAASLLRTVAPPVQTAPAPAAPKTPEPTKPSAPPPTATAPPPPPVSVVEPAPAMADGADSTAGPDRLAWMVHLGASGGLGAEYGVMTGASLAGVTAVGLRAGGHIDHSVDTTLKADSSGIGLSRWDFGGFVGIEGPRTTAWCLGLAGSRRKLQSSDPESEVYAVIPQVRGQVVVPLKRSAGPTLALTGLAGLDLRSTEIRETSAPAEALPRWTVGLGVALTQRTRTPWGSP